MKLTDRFVFRLTSDRERGQRFHDEDLPGFFCAVYRSGRKVFGVRFGPETGRRQVKIGAFGPISARTARKEAQKILGQIALGTDPREGKVLLGSPSFRAWRDTYVSRILNRKKTAWQDDRYLRIAGKRWDSRALASITREDVEGAVRDLSSTPIQANRFLASVRACLEDARRSGHLQRNPAWDVRAFPENPPRSRVLSREEMVSLLAALEREPDVSARVAVRMLIETGARQGEVLSAKWEDLDLRERVWRLPQTKAGTPQFLPLAAATVKMLRRLPRASAFVVAGRGLDRKRYDLRGPWKRLRRAAFGDRDITLHDIRRTFGLSVAKAAGVLVASRLLRHADVRVTAKVYAPLGLDDLRPAMERHCSEVEEARRLRKSR